MSCWSFEDRGRLPPKVPPESRALRIECSCRCGRGTMASCTPAGVSVLLLTARDGVEDRVPGHEAAPVAVCLRREGSRGSCGAAQTCFFMALSFHWTMSAAGKDAEPGPRRA